MSSIPQFTTVVAVDDAHLLELEIAWQTWRAFKPEIMANPLLVICDVGVQVGNSDFFCMDRFMRCPPFIEHPCMQLIGYCGGKVNWSQRERMLTALIMATEHVTDPYYLKLDCDTLATAAGPWINPDWFTNSPAFIAPPWGYTKPASMLTQLDEWARGIPDLCDLSPPARWLHGDTNRNRACSRRIISYCMFGNTQWTREAAKLFGERLPAPSQDTCLWYLAERRGDHYIRARMPGWKHCGGNLAKMKRLAAELLPAGAKA